MPILGQIVSIAAVIVQGHGSAAVSKHGESMTEAEISLGRFHKSPWIRVTVIDRAVKRAWSNPIWFDN